MGEAKEDNIQRVLQIYAKLSDGFVVISWGQKYLVPFEDLDSKNSLILTFRFDLGGNNASN